MKMVARISTLLPCTEHQLWQKIIEPRPLRYVSSPILSFIPVEPGALDSEWRVGRAYPLKLYFLKFIPLGRHSIRLVKIEQEANTISSEESGSLARVWNHNIWFHADADGKLAYTDEIEIQAGWLTPAIWFFAHLFYRRRQRRWKAFLKQINH